MSAVAAVQTMSTEELLAIPQELTAEPHLPGLRIKVAEIFEE